LGHTIDFFENLQRLLRLEREAQKARFIEETQQRTLEEREDEGHLVLDLELTEESVGLGGRFLLTFAREKSRPMRTPPQPGDLASLRPRRSEAPAPANGTIVRSTPFQVTVAFERPPPEFLADGRMLLELIPNDITFDRARDAVAQVAAMDKGQVRHTREVLLGNEAPLFEKASPLEATTHLNPEQREAAERALSAQDFFLIHGPPGTGKSTVLGQVAKALVSRGEQVLCTAASNAAVDHLLELCLALGLRALRVGHPARVAEHLREHTLDVVVEEHPDRKLAREWFDEAHGLLGYARRQRTQGRSRERFANARASQAEARKLMDDARALERKALNSVLGGADIICATLASLPSTALTGRSFETALVDEATQAMEPLALLAYTKARRIILAGDHRQLGPTVLSLDAAKQGLGKSLFERLLEEHGEGVKKMLREQHRMSEELMGFPSAEMYEGELRAHSSVAKRRLAEVLPAGTSVDAPPFLFLDTAGKGFEDEVEVKGQSYFNRGEAELTVARARELLALGLPPGELALIAPYRAQVALLRQSLGRADVEVDTVDAFQGREKDVVLVSLTRSNTEQQLGFLNELRRVNVAITRAKRHLFVVGDSATVSSHPYYGRLVERAHALQGYRSAWEWPGVT
jgi:superfamily I DNA and/or RNA helicase